MNGFLDPKGILHKCEAWEHLDTALEITEDMNPAIHNRLEAEQYLQEQGWIVVRNRDVYGLIGIHYNEKEECLHLTKEQKRFLEEIYGEVNTECQKSIDKLFDWDK